MDLRMSHLVRLVVFIGVVGLGWNAPAWGYAGSSSMLPQGSLGPRAASAEEQLNRCIEMAQEGDVEQAFDLAREAKSMYSSQRMFDVSYINTLIAIVKATEDRYDPRIINEAIGAVNAARARRTYDGQGDAEASYHFMKALSSLAEVTMLGNERVSSKIRIYEGQIAENLKDNPSFPQAAMEALAGSMISMAEGYAIREDTQAAVAALREAVEMGFGELDLLDEWAWVSEVMDAEEVADLKVELGERYEEVVDQWARQSMAEFRRRAFSLDVAGLDGRRIRQGDFTGHVLVVDLWATWCAPCKKGIPHYMALQEEMESEGVQVLGVSMDRPEQPESTRDAVAAFAEATEFNYPIALGDSSLSRQLPGKLALPTTLFFDRQGQLRYIAAGYHDYAKIEAITRRLAAESQPVRTGMPATNF